MHAQSMSPNLYTKMRDYRGCILLGNKDKYGRGLLTGKGIEPLSPNYETGIFTI